jgi:hypothetical protein
MKKLLLSLLTFFVITGCYAQTKWRVAADTMEMGRPSGSPYSTLKLTSYNAPNDSTKLYLWADEKGIIWGDTIAGGVSEMDIDSFYISNDTILNIRLRIGLTFSLNIAPVFNYYSENTALFKPDSLTLTDGYILTIHYPDTTLSQPLSILNRDNYYFVLKEDLGAGEFTALVYFSDNIINVVSVDSSVSSLSTFSGDIMSNVFTSQQYTRFMYSGDGYSNSITADETGMFLTTDGIGAERPFIRLDENILLAIENKPAGINIRQDSDSGSVIISGHAIAMPNLSGSGSVVGINENGWLSRTSGGGGAGIDGFVLIEDTLFIYSGTDTLFTPISLIQNLNGQPVLLESYTDEANASVNIAAGDEWTPPSVTVGSNANPQGWATFTTTTPYGVKTTAMLSPTEPYWFDIDTAGVYIGGYLDFGGGAPLPYKYITKDFSDGYGPESMVFMGLEFDPITTGRAIIEARKIQLGDPKEYSYGHVLEVIPNGLAFFESAYPDSSYIGFAVDAGSGMGWALDGGKYATYTYSKHPLVADRINAPSTPAVNSTSLDQADHATDDSAGYNAIPAGGFYRNTLNIIFWKP